MIYLLPRYALSPVLGRFSSISPDSLCGLTKVPIIYVTVDNASANDVVVGYVKKRINAWKVSVLDGKFILFRCGAHILNLIVGDGLKELCDSIDAIRNSVRYIRSSSSKLQKFNVCVEREKITYKGGLVLDVPTRWNSTFMMLDVALKFEKAFASYEDENHKYLSHFLNNENEKKRVGPPKSIDWKCVSPFVKFLSTFYEVTLKFSATLHVKVLPSSALPQVTRLSFVRQIVAKITVKVEEILNELFEVYNVEFGGGESKVIIGKLYAKQQLQVPEKMNDLQRYLVEESLDPTTTEFDILLWWKANASRYAILSMIAKDVLVILVSTVAIESAFSTSGRILDSFRSSLSPKMLEALVCTQSWLKDLQVLNTDFASFKYLQETDLLELGDFPADY
ncbi:zinc finger BED domain-containing protein RICESLEEPER 2-like [Cynara cardunculus var. scolymus]|uniref:zinc finger BED domain-containing protein RICESLEEPER 2-like n=1 Tax=Cynara cardunculus var. scolymus TaxID=59895 RepID=UPI000D62555A|nr:zinc finger BED domain-containing protein RICESLEEPER 2-like [Cynara cardunculus var. scolymus]